MRHILVIGSGKSTSYLFKYLLEQSETENLHITVGDLDIENAKKMIGNHKNATAITLDVFDKNSREDAVKKADMAASIFDTPEGDIVDASDMMPDQTGEEPEEESEEETEESETETEQEEE